MSTRDRLIESTRELLWTRGYVGTSPRAIMDLSGVGQGSLYHHFTGKADLALAAVQRSATELKELASEQLGPPGTATQRIARWLKRERAVLRGCPIGGLAQDPEIVADPALRAPVDEALGWLTARVAEILAEGQADGELDDRHDPGELAATILAVLQGGYVLARAADSAAPFDRAIAGILALLVGCENTTGPQ
jgi:TetR/AcrR family transcriptional regulator, transcriptional repressor for nem operon